MGTPRNVSFTSQHIEFVVFVPKCLVDRGALVARSVQFISFLAELL